jgi:hypothetical protein
MQGKRQVLMAGITAAMMTVMGCRVDTSKPNENGKPNVKVATPFGGVQVKTDDALVEQGLGLPIYPGAELVKKDDKKTEAADVNLSFGKFQLRVKAAHYRTPDAPEKVQAFYEDALKRYGTVIECNDGHAVGTPTRTDEGLTCEEGTHGKSNSDTAGKIELKAGSKQHQHIVGIDPDGSGTKFGVVALDLPGNITIGDEDNRQ